MIVSLTCPFLAGLSATELVALFANDVNNQLACVSLHPESLNPVWLNNEEQNVVGIFPKCQFVLLPPSASESAKLSIDPFKANQFTTNQLATNQLKINQIERNAEFPFTNSHKTSYAESMQGLITRLLNYQAQQVAFVDTSVNLSNDTASDAFDDNSNRYLNGFIGFIGYDVTASDLANKGEMQTEYFSQYSSTETDDSNAIADSSTPSSTASPSAYLAHYDIYLTCQKQEKEYLWQLHCSSDESQARMQAVYQWLEELGRQVAEQNKGAKQLLVSIRLTASWHKQDYQHAFKKTQDYLYAGDCYQVNLTQEWRGKLAKHHRLVDYLPRLHRQIKAPFAGYLGLQSFELLSCSPELFFTFIKDDNAKEGCAKKGNQQVSIITKPIKGTRPRGQTPAEDEQLKAELANSKKDLAENVMIVDLLRNDLGKYAQTGTVRVPKRFAIESFSNVHHMVSTITAKIKADSHLWEVLFGSLPAGSITGTPKKRSVEIINELEDKARGAYCGTMGYLNFDGTGQWNVLIRTLQADNQGNVSLWAGGGITVGSECEAEYQECWDKVGNILRLLA